MKPDAAWLLSGLFHLVAFAMLDVGDPDVRTRQTTPFELVDFVPAEASPPEPKPPPTQPEPEPPPEPAAEPPPPQPAPEPPPTPPKPAQPAPAPDPAPTPAPVEPVPLTLNLTLGNATDGSVGVASGTETTPGSGRPAGPSSTTTERPRPSKPTCAETASKPKPIHKVQIQYPAQARDQGLAGRVVLRANVDRHGRVTKVDVLQSAGGPLDDAVARALEQWTFAPALACGKPVASSYKIARVFELGG